MPDDLRAVTSDELLWVPDAVREERERAEARRLAQAVLRQTLGLPADRGPSVKELRGALGTGGPTRAQVERRRERAKAARRARKRNRR